jgi:hypothetical protein
VRPHDSANLPDPERCYNIRASKILLKDNRIIEESSSSIETISLYIIFVGISSTLYISSIEDNR